jgi:hypothetical protein
MDEGEFRATLSKEELEARAFIVPFKVLDVEVWERLNRYSTELSKPYDFIVNTALTRFFDDIDAISRLRMKP